MEQRLLQLSRSVARGSIGDNRTAVATDRGDERALPRVTYRNLQFAARFVGFYAELA